MEYISFLGKFMVSVDDYAIFKFGGSSLKNEEYGIKTMLQYFTDYFTEKELKQSLEHYNLQKMFQIVKKYFIQEYGYVGKEIELCNNYQKSINSYINMDDVNPIFIHIDELFESTVIGFLIAMFKWSKDFSDLNIYGNCFKYILYLLNDVCIFGEMQEAEANKLLMETLNGDIQILQLAEDCYWTIVIFSLAHEMAHAYMKETLGSEYKKLSSIEEEYNADAIAYNIVLKIIIEENTVLEKYTYLAPMMYMDFFDLYYYTDWTLYGFRCYDFEHPFPPNRKERLFMIVDREEYDFDTVEGNNLYGGFCDVYEEYKEQVHLKMERGKLKKILRTERRKQLRRKDNNDER